MASSPQHEPTMEEILASIRKIISEDSPEAAIPAAAPVAAPKPVAVEPAAAEPEAEVLELTQEVREEPKPAAAPHVEPVADDAGDIMFEPKQEAAPSPIAMSPARADAPVHSGEGIFSDKTKKAFDDSFSRLGPVDEEPMPAPPPRETSAAIAPVDGHTVEAVYDRAIRESFDPVLRDWLDANADAVVDRMKPVIREWLDQHFPAMLEDAVQGEVARVVKARRR